MFSFSILALALFVFQGALLSDARPPPSTALSSRAKITRKLKSTILGPDGPDRREYNLTLLPEADQGIWSDTYEIEGKFMGHYAILKVVPVDGDKTALEATYLKQMGLLLDFEQVLDLDAYFVVFKNVRADNMFLPFYEWYLADETMDVQKALADFRKSIKTDLTKTALMDKLLYHDFSLSNVFVDRTFRFPMPVDWSPPENGFAGVEKVLSGTKEIQLAEFTEYLQEYIPERINIDNLANQLEKRGHKLRPSDAALVTGRG